MLMPNPTIPMQTPSTLRLAGLALATLGFAQLAADSAASAPQDPDAGQAIVDLLRAEGIELDLTVGAIAVPARVLVTGELLEYLLVNNLGATHESLLVTDVTPSLLNAGLLALGLEPGENMRFEAVAPDHVALEQGAAEVRLVPPTGDGVLPYLAWKEGDEVYFVRVEDVLCDLAAERSMRRHRWVFLGSRFANFGPDRGEQFVADVEGNLINLAFFTEGSTIATSALPECLDQTIWGANDWLLPPRGEAVQLILATERLRSVPATFASALPEPDRTRNGIAR